MHEGHSERSVVGAESFQEIELGLLSWKSLAASQRAGLCHLKYYTYCVHSLSELKNVAFKDNRSFSS